MIDHPDYEQAQQILIDLVRPVETEQLPLSQCGGRILAQDLIAQDNIPPFDRSPYDGYALRTVDIAAAAKASPVTLQILEEVPAGAVPTQAVTAGTAVKILTGAPIPAGADAVVMYEKTEFTKEYVKIFAPLQPGENIIVTGEDVGKGEVLARCGDPIDPGLAGTLAAQGVAAPLVYRLPRIGILSTGRELVEAYEIPAPGKIRNSNRYMLEAALKQLGCEPVYFGIAGDKEQEIAAQIDKGLLDCDAMVITGGVSVGDYDMTPSAMEAAGAQILFRGVDMKPGMACTYGHRNGKLICGLSGNPASALTNFYAVALPALRKLTGRRDFRLAEIRITLNNGFKKKSPKTRFLRGKLILQDGRVGMELPKDQGNVVLSSSIGCNVMAVIPAGSGPVEAGRILKGYLL